MKVLVVFYSMYGHLYKMAEAVAEGAKEVQGAEVVIRRVPETIPEDVLKKTGALDAQKQFAHIPEVSLEDLESANAIIFAIIFFSIIFILWPCTGTLDIG